MQSNLPDRSFKENGLFNAMTIDPLHVHVLDNSIHQTYKN